MPLGGDDGVGGYGPLTLVTGAGGGASLSWVHGNHLGVPLLYADGSGAQVTPAAHTMPGFPGQLRTLADLYYNRHRDYDSSTGRYIQADPIGLEGGSNAYLYAEGNPLSYVDPDGRNPLLIAGAVAIGSAVVAAGLDLGLQAAVNAFAGRNIFDPNCYDWTSVGVSAALGAVTGGAGALRPALRAAKKIAVIGRMDDLAAPGVLRPGEYRIADKLSDLGSPKANYYNNMSVLRKEMRRGVPIRDASAAKPDNFRVPTALNPGRTVRQTFTGAERNQLRNRGWTFDGQYWNPPK